MENKTYYTRSEIVKSNFLPACSKSKKYQILNYLIYTGKLPAYDLNGLRVFKADDLATAIDKCKVVESCL